MEAIPKQPPEGDVSGMGPTGKQDVKLDQGKCVPSALNAPANILIMLMRKDAWTVTSILATKQKSKKGQLMGQVQK